MENLFQRFFLTAPRTRGRALLAIGCSLAFALIAGCADTLKQPGADSSAVPRAGEPAGSLTEAKQLTSAARGALQNAQLTIAWARKEGALWTRASEMLGQARDAAVRLDSEATLQFATEARQFAELGLQQKHYPPVRELTVSK
jgi:hypothetical protein